jgi:hypothetical protein
MATWVITEDNGQWTLTHGRTRKEFSSQDAAMDYVREHSSSKDKIFREEDDGYRTPLKKPRHWRR